MDTELRLTEVRSGMLKAIIILPSQYFGPRRNLAPERRLMAAVLEDAIDCIAKYRYAKHYRGRRLFHEAVQWLLAEETDWPYSFECICGVLDLDASAVRGALHLPEGQSAVSPEVRPAIRNDKGSTAVNVAVKNRAARLTGTVPSGTPRFEAAVVAWSPLGVCPVPDNPRRAPAPKPAVPPTHPAPAPRAQRRALCH